MSRALYLLLACLLVGGMSACFSDGEGSDFDADGLTDQLEDRNENVLPDPGEADFTRPDTDNDTLCDGLPRRDLPACTGCEDCNLSGTFEPCLGETDPLNDDTDGDGIRDASDPRPVDRLAIDCSGGNVELDYGASLPEGKPFPTRPPLPTSTPRPTVTPGPTISF